MSFIPADSTSSKSGAGFNIRASENLGFALGTTGQKASEMSRVDWSEMNSRGSAGDEPKVSDQMPVA